jgi:hypothetical protein
MLGHTASSTTSPSEVAQRQADTQAAQFSDWNDVAKAVRDAQRRAALAQDDATYRRPAR